MHPQTLMITVLAALAAASLGAAPAQHHESKTLPPPSTGVAVEASFHDVEVTVKPGGQVRVTVDMEISASTEAKARELLEAYAPTYEEKDGTLTIRSRRRDGADLDRGFLKMEGKIALEMPPDLILTVRISSGDISVSGDLGKGALVAEVASGDVLFEGAASALHVMATSGDFTGRLTRPAGSAAFDMASGDVTLEGPAASFKVETASGSVTARGLTGPAVMEAASGDLSASWAEVAPGMEVAVRAASGGIMLGFPDGTTVEGSARSASGTVDSAFPGTPAKRGNAFDFHGGSGAVRVSASTASGDIKVFKTTPGGAPIGRGTHE